jgi:uncharacterized protein YjbJ (UPF0337 family)
MMNKEQFQGQWNQLKGKIKEKWGKLTDDDITAINGKYDQFIGKLQQRYGLAKDKAETDFNEFFSKSSSVASKDEEVHPRKNVKSERPHGTNR